MATNINSYIVQTPGVLGGKPRIANTRISVRSIVGWYKRGFSPEEIAEQFRVEPKEFLAQVYAALAYYHANQDEIEAEILAEESAYDQLIASSDEISEKA